MACLLVAASEVAVSRFHGTRKALRGHARLVGQGIEMQDHAMKGRKSAPHSGVGGFFKAVLVDGTVFGLVRGILPYAGDALNGDAEDAAIDAGTTDGSLHTPRVAAVADAG